MKRIAWITAVMVFSAGPLLAQDKAAEMAKYVERLKSPDPKARATAAEEIGKLAQVKASLGKPALEPLKEALKDKVASVRANAALALAKLDAAEQTVPVLIDLLKTDKEDSVKIAAAQGLGLMGGEAKSAKPALQKVYQEARDAEKMRLAQIAREAMRRISGRSKN